MKVQTSILFRYPDVSEDNPIMSSGFLNWDHVGTLVYSWIKVTNIRIIINGSTYACLGRAVSSLAFSMVNESLPDVPDDLRLVKRLYQSQKAPRSLAKTNQQSCFLFTSGAKDPRNGARSNWDLLSGEQRWIIKPCKHCFSLLLHHTDLFIVPLITMFPVHKVYCGGSDRHFMALEYIHTVPLSTSTCSKSYPNTIERTSFTDNLLYVDHSCEIKKNPFRSFQAVSTNLFPDFEIDIRLEKWICRKNGNGVIIPNVSGTWSALP